MRERQAHLCSLHCRPEGAKLKPVKVEKTAEQVQKDIQDIMRQITSSVTFLPALQDKCTSRCLCYSAPGLTLLVRADVFTILTYAAKDTEVPKEWIESDPHMIIGNAEQVRRPLFVAREAPANSTHPLEQVKLRSFSTNRHKVKGLVAYRLGADML